MSRIARLAGRLLVVAALAAVLAIVAQPPAALAAPGPSFTPGRAISIAASNPSVGPLEARYPRAIFTAVYRPSNHTWRVRLAAPSGHPVYASFTILDGIGSVVSQSINRTPGPPHLTAGRAYRIAGREPRIRSWLGLYSGLSHTATLGDNRVWTISWYSGGKEVAEVQVADATGQPSSVWTGPQVSWMMTRGLPDAYGRKVVSPWVLIPMCLLFIGGLINWRKPLSMRTLDVLMMLSLTVSLVFFDRGDVFVSTPLIYPPLIYLTIRMLQIGVSHRPRDVQIGEIHMLVLVALIFGLMGFRLGLNNQDSNIIDVGYAGVAGASRLLHGVLPYGHMPRAAGTACGGTYANGDPVGYVQSDHRCESPIENGDTYGPVVYLAYAPAVLAFGWSGLWDSLPAAHVAASAFDILAVAGLFVAGWRLRSARIGVMLAFAWAANPFTAYTLNMNANDALVGAAVAWTLAALSLPAVRGAMLAVASLTKLGPLAMVPVFLHLRNRLLMIAGFVVAAIVLLAMLALDPHGLRLFWDRTVAYQADRITPLSIWTLGNYHPGWPHLEWLQQIAQIAVAIGVGLLAFLPRGERDAAAVAALSGAALLAVQMVASYWFYPYVCWWLPAVLIGFLLPRAGRRQAAPVSLPA